jgi:hypothetical protein
MVSREQALARIAALEMRTAPIRKAPPMGQAASDLAIVLQLDPRRRSSNLNDVERRVAALEARVRPIVDRANQ